VRSCGARCRPMRNVGKHDAPRRGIRVQATYHMLIWRSGASSGVYCPKFASIQRTNSQDMVSWSGLAAIQGDIIMIIGKRGLYRNHPAP